jgi:hypothetical protein
MISRSIWWAGGAPPPEAASAENPVQIKSATAQGTDTGQSIGDSCQHGYFAKIFGYSIIRIDKLVEYQDVAAF